MRRNMRRAAEAVHGIDGWLILALIVLLCVGVVMVYSSSMADAYVYYGTPYYYLERELIWVGIGLVALVAAVQIPYLRWQQIALPFFGMAVFFLGLAMLPGLGHQSHGAQRWITIIPGMPFEPSELLKLALLVYLATWLPSKGAQIRDLKHGFLPFSAIVGVIAIVIIRQPDLGTAIVISLSAFAVYFLAGASVKHMAIVAVGAVAVAWGLSHGSGYRSARLTAFTNPFADPTGTGYHTVHALMALRSGGLFGVGLGNSVQKWALPAPHTDSILAVIGEELGLAGAGAVLLLFLIVAYRGMKISASAPDPFSRLLAAGITCWITFQALMNFAVITSSVPFTGVPLPFISFGGTSLVITMTAVGILLNISRHTSGEGFARQNVDNGRGNGRPRLPRVVHHPVSARPATGRRITGARG